MSDTKKKDVNSELPDQDALAAFANSALGSRRRRRGAASPAEEASADAQPGQSAHGETEVQPQVEEAATAPPEPTAAPLAAEEPKAAVPGPAPESPPVPGPSREPRPQEPRTTARTPRDAKTSAEVQVRAVAVPVTSTPIPPGLQDGRTIEVQVPALGPMGARATQCTIMASQNVRERFAHYQLSKKMAGEKEPSNALVIRRAFLHAKRGDLFRKLLADLYHQATAVDDEDYDEDGLLGDVIGRRTVRGRLKDSGQQSFRPSEQELATYDAYSQAYGFPSRSDFLNAVLDEFLPQLPASGRRR